MTALSRDGKRATAVLLALGAAALLSRFAANGGAPQWSPRLELARTDTTAYLIVSTSCPVCSSEATIDRVRRAHAHFSNTSTRRTVGVSLDTDLAAGRALLESYGDFDEMILGGSWTNFAAVGLVWSDSLALGGVPQVVIVERVFDTPNGRVALKKHTILRRSYGVSMVIEALANPTAQH